MPDTCNRGEIISRNRSGEGLGINKRIHLHCFLVRRVAVIARTNRVAGQNDRNPRLGFQYLEFGLHASMSLTIDYGAVCSISWLMNRAFRFTAKTGIPKARP